VARLDRTTIIALTCAIAFAVPAATPGPGYGQQANQDGSPATFNYAFATQLGSGIYRVDERTIQVYRLAGPINLRRTDVDQWGLRLLIPVTFGFYNFKIEDVVDIGLPSALGTLAIVPMLESGYHLKGAWWVGPFLGFGAGKDFSGGEFNWIYALGLRSYVIFPGKHVDTRLGNRLVYTGYTNKEMGFVDDFAFLETGVDLRRPVGIALGGFDIDASIFGANYIYFISPHIVRADREPVEMRTEWEVGFTVGTAEPWKVLKITMPRLGLSYRFGTGTDAVRIIIGNPFPIPSPTEQGAGVD